MGTSLNGLAPKDTYQSLLKTTDNTIINSTLKTISDGSGNDTALQLSTLRVGVNADSSVTTQTSSVIQATTTNANLVLAPNGTGAIVAQIPDGTVTGGNARGTNATDFQKSRNNANEVASGNYSFIGSGIANKSTNLYSSVTGGENNTASGTWSFIGSGSGNVSSSSWSVVSGGQSNAASSGTHATVVGGQGNTSSGQYSVAGGQSNTASGQYSVALGNNNIASGNGCVSIGSSNTSQFATSVSIGNSNTGSNNRTYAFGNGNNISAGDSLGLGNSNTLSGSNNLFAFGTGNILNTGTNSFAIGYQNTISTSNGISLGISGNVSAPYATSMGQWSRSYLYGQVSIANGLLGGSQNAQQSLLTAYNSTALTTGGTQVLSLDGTGVTNLIIPYGTNRAWNVQVNWVAVVTAITGTATGVTVGDTITQVQTLGFKRIGGTSSLIGMVNTLSTNTNTSMSTASMTYSAGASQEMAMTFTAPTFTGGGTITCRVVARVELTEVAY